MDECGELFVDEIKERLVKIVSELVGSNIRN